MQYDLLEPSKITRVSTVRSKRLHSQTPSAYGSRGIIQRVSRRTARLIKARHRQLHISFIRWRRKSKRVRKHDLDLYPRWGPAWHAITQSLWTEYEELEAKRKALALPCYAWQQNWNSMKDQEKRARAAYYSPVGRDAHHLWPLSVCMREYLRPGSCFEEPVEQRKFPWRTLKHDWTDFCDMMESDEGGDLRESLSPSQKPSYEILAAWWQSRYLPSRLVDTFRRMLEEWDNVSFKGFPRLLHQERFVMQSAQLGGSSMYHLYCLELLIREFHPFRWEPYDSAGVTSLETLRHQVGELALFQRIGHASLYAEGSLALPARYPRVSEKADNSYQPRKRLRSTEPYFLWDVLRRQTVEVSKLSHLPDYVCISHTWGRWVLRHADGLPVTVRLQDQVPWLVPTNTQYRVEDLPDQFAELGASYIWFDLFCIPQDSGDPNDDLIFAAPEGLDAETVTGARLRTVEIGRQVEIFRGASRTIGWIHDAASWDGLCSALDWLGLKYLANTSMFDYPGTSIGTRIEEAAEKATLSLPELVIPLKNASRAPLMQAPIVDKKLYIPFQGEAFEPASWFTSLWTLQEAALRPDMTLCSRNWDVLQDRCGASISLSALFQCLHNMNTYAYADGPPRTKYMDQDAWEHYFWRIRRTDWTQSHPTGVGFLQDFRWLTIMGEMLMAREFSAVAKSSLDIYSADILRIANLRECHGPRTPAVMSAVGATDWYRKRVVEGREGEQGHLVLGVYELDFVREVARKLGSSFYMSMVRFDTRINSPQRRPSKAIGSMMPFSPHAAKLPTDESMDTRVNHTSVRSWEITEDGSVHIQSAGILTSSEDIRGPSTRFMIFYGVEDENEPGIDQAAGVKAGVPSEHTFGNRSTEDFWNKPAGFRSTTDLRGALVDLSRDGRDEIIAVALFEGAVAGQMQHGIILQSPRIDERLHEGPRQFVKIGIYRSYYWKFVKTRLQMPPTTTVDWIVV